MTSHRIGLLTFLCGALAAAGCSAGTAPPAAEPLGTLQAAIAAPPIAVRAVLVTVTGSGIATPMRTLLTADLDGRWSGRVVNVPPGLGRVVTAYAYSVLDVPADPVADDTGLIYRGSRTNVMVTAGQLTGVVVPLLPYPDGGGQIGLNTPPHLVAVGHAATMASNGSTTFTATAIDPDAVALLTYEWSDSAGGTFTGGDGQVTGNHPSGETVTVDYLPPPGFTGVPEVTVTAFDGAALASTRFTIDVGAGLAVGVIFDVLPTIQILPGANQSLVPGAQTVIEFDVSYPADAGPDALAPIRPTLTWFDSCGGTFSDTFDPNPLLFPLEQPRRSWVVYTAPSVAPPAPGRCDLRLFAVTEYGSKSWTGLIAWVNPTVTGLWSGPATDLVRGPFVATFDIIQAGDSVAGSYTTDFGGTGTFSGTTDGTTISFTVDVTNAGCAGQLLGTAAVDPDTGVMAMSYAGSTCFGPTTGSGALSKVLGKVAFLTSTAYAGDLGGLPGADEKCQARADVGINLGVLPAGTYRALLSTSFLDARDRVADTRWVLPDGTPVATSRDDLFDGSIAHGIDQDELGNTGMYQFTWSATDPLGRLWSPFDTCVDWTDGTDFNGSISGFSNSSNPQWISANGFSCSATLHLYCLQQ